MSTPTSDLTTAKYLINSILSTRNAKRLISNIVYFYLNIKMTQFEYMRMKLDVIPDEIITQYKLYAISHHGWIYMEIQKGMYDLKQAGLLVNIELTCHLVIYGYVHVK